MAQRARPGPLWRTPPPTLTPICINQFPCAGIRIIVNEQHLADIQADIDGPTGTPYEAGTFRMRLTLPSDYPSSPPKGFFTTKIFHPNVSTSGDICVNVLKRDWTADTTLGHVLMVVRCLLIQPFPDSALNEEAGRLLLEAYEEYDKHARLMTSIHAAAPKRPGPLTASGANAATEGATSKPGKEGAGEASSPVLKKAKPDQQKAGASSSNLSKVKKSLKRL